MDDLSSSLMRSYQRQRLLPLEGTRTRKSFPAVRFLGRAKRKFSNDSRKVGLETAQAKVNEEESDEHPEDRQIEYEIRATSDAERIGDDYRRLREGDRDGRRHPQQDPSTCGTARHPRTGALDEDPRYRTSDSGQRRNLKVRHRSHLPWM
jgi:hypothetical protein